ncbi:YitT family protein [Paenisporosarcina quisquiliarum]|uniref:YitT family protein n=1 Tax=Paenisporosarcina quisquiliarum TaxID=365346 RepID=A0A9X3LIM1_9BACL|nr:YitT family protein [Paenisporosarcina quisquiliarum]MCZ8537696.1 YitT family protein [Paenisporosarcina quisquiliarum]
MPFIHKTISILVGSLLMAIGVNVFLINHELLDGGTFGMGLILHYLTGMQVGLLVILLSIPVLILALFYNRSFLYNSIHGMLISSFIVDLTYHPLRVLGYILDQNPLGSAIMGGIFVGAGIGLMLRYDTSIGGTDLLGQIVANYLKINPGVIIFMIDFVIVFTGYYLIDDSSLVLSFITVICVGTMTSLIAMKRKKEKVPAISFAALK